MGKASIYNTLLSPSEVKKKSQTVTLSLLINSAINCWSYARFVVDKLKSMKGFWSKRTGAAHLLVEESLPGKLNPPRVEPKLFQWQVCVRTVPEEKLKVGYRELKWRPSCDFEVIPAKNVVRLCLSPPRSHSFIYRLQKLKFSLQYKPFPSVPTNCPFGWNIRVQSREQQLIAVLFPGISDGRHSTSRVTLYQQCEIRR